MKPVLPLLAVVAIGLAGCSTVEYAVKEKFGIHKRDILVARVGDAREAQGEARQQFKSELADTERRYEMLIGIMKRAADRMNPVLAKFKDQVLFLKHNLNAQVVARLGSTNA